jgi:hypothetical protein
VANTSRPPTKVLRTLGKSSEWSTRTISAALPSSNEPVRPAFMAEDREGLPEQARIK